MGNQLLLLLLQSEFDDLEKISKHKAWQWRSRWWLVFSDKDDDDDKEATTSEFPDVVEAKPEVVEKEVVEAKTNKEDLPKEVKTETKKESSEEKK